MCTRSIEEMVEVFHRAKLELKELLPISQEIVFDHHFSGTDLRLLELDKEIENSINLGDRLVIRGDADDTAVLCTDTATFDLKDVETTNSVLILEKLSFPGGTTNVSTQDVQSKSDDLMEEEVAVIVNQITNDSGENQFIGQRSLIQVAHNYLEVIRIKPNLTRIQYILEPTAYKGSSEEAENTQNGEKGVTLDILLEKVPASKKEIEEHINTHLRIIKLDGSIRLVESTYLFQALSQVLDCIDAFSWDTKRINREIVISELNGLHSELILTKIFNWYFTPQNDAKSSTEEDQNGPVLYSMNEYAICRFLGEIILKSGKRFTLKDFLSAWGESVPNGLKVDLKQLEGLAVSDSESSPPAIWYFPEEALPETIQDRFTVLFETKSKWTREEILPYIENATVSTQAATLFLGKYSRVHTVRGIKYHFAKHGK